MPDDNNRPAKRHATVLLWIAALFTLAASAVFGWRDEKAEMALAIAAGGMVMAFASLDKIELFKGGGVELRTLRQQLDKNAATIRHLQDLAVMLARPILGLTASAGRWGGSSAAGDVARELNAQLIRMGIVREKIEEANKVYNAYMAFDHGQHIEMKFPRNLTVAENEEVGTLKNYERLYAASPNEYRAKLMGMGLLDAEVEEAIKDYEHFLEHRELRRPDEWCVPRIRG